MTLTQAQRADAAQRLIKAATGFEYGDGDIVTNMGTGYAEPGYGGGGDTLWVLGNWNNKTTYDRETGERTVTSTVPERLHDALDRLGIECEWLDEWYQCGECYRAVRSVEDSYSWTPSFVFTDGEITCHECAAKNLGDFITEYVNDSSRAITWADRAQLEAIGFVIWESHDEHTYANGFHPGQDDNPADIMTRIHQTDSSLDVIFIITGSGQFDIHFQAMTRSTETEQ